MNGQLLLLLISMLMQNPGGDLLPAPNRNGSQGFPSGLPANAPVLPPDMAAANSAVGWGTDKSDGKFCMIIQIAPEAIAAFAKGLQGQELTADIPESIRNRIEKVIVRIGNGQVERNPPNPQSISENRPNGNWPQIATLENRSPVTIDQQPRPPALFNASGGSGLPKENGQLNPGSMVNNGHPVGTFASNGSNTGGFAGAPGYDNGNPILGNLPTSARNDLLPNTPSSAKDGFQPMQNRPLDFLQRSNSGAPGLPSSSYPSSQGNYANQPNYSIQGYANPNQGYPNQGNVPSSTNRPYSQVAQNTNPVSNYNDNFTAQPPNTNSNSPPYTQPNIPPSIAQSQQYGAPPLQQPSQYAPTHPYLAGSNTSFLTTPPPVRTPTNPNLQTNYNLTNDDQALSKDKLIPFLLLFSIVGNVYLGLWMSHLRARYRQLLSNMRGIPVSDLSN